MLHVYIAVYYAVTLLYITWLHDHMLHVFAVESPIIIWETSTNGSAIRKVLWSRSCAYIIFVLDSNSIVHMWDLLRNDAEPMASEQVSEANSR